MRTASAGPRASRTRSLPASRTCKKPHRAVGNPRSVAHTLLKTMSQALPIAASLDGFSAERRP